MSLSVDPRFYFAKTGMKAGLPSYVHRQADKDLEVALRQGDYVNLLSSRKVGKSSLLNQVFQRLHDDQASPIRCALVELTQASVTQEKFYETLARQLSMYARQKCDHDVPKEGPDSWVTWWANEQAQAPPDRFIEFLRRYFLEATTWNWVIALDEIDCITAHPYSDDLFATIRRCQGARAHDPLMERLTFLLAGVSTPARLIKDRRRTPYNFGTSIDLKDFSPEEAVVLLQGLAVPADVRHPALMHILGWTSGHPYLTQRLFQELASQLSESEAMPQTEDAWRLAVDEAVQNTMIRPPPNREDPLLEDIGERQIGNLDHQDHKPKPDRSLKRRVLQTYRTALTKTGTVEDEALAAPVVHLKLCGLLVSDPHHPKRLKVRNRIYETVFDQNWIREEMPRDNARWIVAAALLVSALSLVGAFFQRVSNLMDNIAEADTDVPAAAYSALVSLPFQQQRADLAMAGYWTRQALKASAAQPRDQTALLSLQSLAILHRATAAEPAARYPSVLVPAPGPQRSLQSRRALSGSFAHLLATFRHGEAVRSAAFNTDGSRVVTASFDGTARVWDTVTGQPVGAPLTHKGLVSSAAFSLDGLRIITASVDGTARIWDALTGRPIGAPLNNKGALNFAAFNKSGTRVVTASVDNTARIWDALTSMPIGAPLNHAASVASAAFSADGTRVVTASNDNTARIWDALTGKPIGTPLGHDDSVNSAAFSEDGTSVVTSSVDNTARIWDALSGKPTGPPLSHDDSVNSAVFSKDGGRVVTASNDNTARIWDALTGEPIGAPLNHMDWVSSAVFSTDGTRVLTASLDDTARIWDSVTAEPIGTPLTHDNSIISAAFSSDGKRVVTASFDNTARFWNALNGMAIGAPLDNDRSVSAAAFSLDGTRVVTTNSDNAARIWNAATGKAIGAPLQHDDFLISVAFSTDGTRVVTTSFDKTARIWDAETSQSIGVPLHHDSSVISASFSTDGTRVITASGDSARIWDLATGRQAGASLHHDDSVYSAEFSANGTRVVTASEDNTARIWDALTCMPVGAPLTHAGYVRSAAFSADGTRVVTASEDKTARIWDALTGKPIGSPLNHDRLVNSVAFSTDGTRVITVTLRKQVWWSERSDERWTSDGVVWSNGVGWIGKPLPLSADGRRVQVLESWGAGTFTVRTLVLDEAEEGLPQLNADPAELLQIYQQRFALKFEDITKSPRLVPLYPVPQKQDRQ